MQAKAARRSNEARVAETTGRLLDAARALFVEKGYAGAGTPAIVARAGVTRGALYHHFGDKAGLFRAVVEREAETVAARIESRTRQPRSAAEALGNGSRAYFEAMAEAGRARLLLIEGPAVLGHAVMVDIDQRTGGNELKLGLDLAVDLGEMPALPTAPMADILSAAFDRAALAVAGGADPAPYREAAETLLVSLMQRRRAGADAPESAP